MYVYSVLVLNGLVLGVAGELGGIVEVSRGDRFAYRIRIVRVGASFNLNTYIIHTYIHTYLRYHSALNVLSTDYAYIHPYINTYTQCIEYRIIQT